MSQLNCWHKPSSWCRKELLVRLNLIDKLVMWAWTEFAVCCFPLLCKYTRHMDQLCQRVCIWQQKYSSSLRTGCDLRHSSREYWHLSLRTLPRKYVTFSSRALSRFTPSVTHIASTTCQFNIVLRAFSAIVQSFLVYQDGEWMILFIMSSHLTVEKECLKAWCFYVQNLVKFSCNFTFFSFECYTTHWIY